MRRIVVCLVGFVISADCSSVSTSVTHFRNPKYEGKGVSRVVVFVDTEDLTLREFTEGKAKSWLKQWGATAFGGTDLFFPGEQTLPDEVRRVFAEKNIDGALFITRSESGFTSEFVTIASTVAEGTMNAQTATLASTTATRSYERKTPWAKFRVELVLVPSGQKIWVGQVDASSRQSSPQRSLWEWAAFETAAALNRQKLLPNPD